MSQMKRAASRGKLLNGQGEYMGQTITTLIIVKWRDFVNIPGELFCTLRVFGERRISMETAKTTTGSTCPVCGTNMLRIETDIIQPNKCVSPIVGEAVDMDHVTFDLCSECGHHEDIFKDDPFDMAKVVLSMFYFNLSLLNKRMANKR